MFSIDLIAGARPNFMKIGPVYKALQPYTDRIACRIVHTGQHYDRNMSEIFFQQLDLPEPDISLDVGSASHAVQTGRIMMAYEQLVLEDAPDLVMVVGDVNSTLACALVAAKLHIPVGHIEAGLRSGDMRMPEEINRLVADRLSTYLFTTCEDGVINLIREGTNQDQIIAVGNTMIDSLAVLLPRAGTNTILDDLGLATRDYLLVTLHRPSNVDREENLGRLLEVLGEISRSKAVLFPVHPRTRQKIARLKAFDEGSYPDLHLLDPLPYLEFIKCQQDAQLVLTDSGGVQEETSYLGVPCLTARENTERPITIAKGTNLLIGVDPDSILEAVRESLAGEARTATPIPLWDGHAGERIADFLLELAAGLDDDQGGE